jgi:signal transduction histidine kinase
MQLLEQLEFFSLAGAIASLVKDIVQKHSGTVRVRSSTRSGRSGTAFRIFLPYSAVSKVAKG